MSVIAFLLLASFAAPAHAEQPASSTPTPIGGTFLQLHEDSTWTEDELTTLGRGLKRLGIAEIIVQWSVTGDAAFYRSPSFTRGEEGPVERLLRMAAAHGLRVRLGLAADPGFWQSTAPGADVEAYLRLSRQRSVTVARELAALAAASASFAGWYITEEIDDDTWRQPARREQLYRYLGDLRMALRELTPGASVAISGFSNARLDPTALEAFWTTLLRRSGIDLVLFQDGIGARKMEVTYAGPFLSAVTRAAEALGRQAAIVVELFEQTGGEPVSDGPFTAEAASFERVFGQLALASSASSQPPVAFSVPDYLYPSARPRAVALLERYSSWLEGVSAIVSPVKR